MPGANAPYLFSQFMEGYQRGAQQKQAQRMQQAQNLMQIAQMHAKGIDESTSKEQRAQHLTFMQDAMDQAEKTMKPGKSGWSQIMGLFGKRDKNARVDPHELLGIPDMTTGNTTGSPSPMPRPNGMGPETPPDQGQGPQPNGLTAPPQGESQIWAPGNDPTKLDSSGNPTFTPGSQEAQPYARPDGVPGNPGLAPSVVGGTAGVESQRNITPPPFSAANPLPPPVPAHEVGAATSFPTAEDVGFANKYGTPLESGDVVKDKATGKGLEMVRVAPGETQFWVNGQQINAGQFDKYRDMLATEGFKADFRKGESAEKITEQTKLFDAQHKAEQEARSASADAYNAWETKNGRKPNPEIDTELRFGVKHDKPFTKAITTQGPDGVRRQVQQNIETGEVYPFSEVVMPQTPQDIDTIAIMHDPKYAKNGVPPTFAQATDIYYKDRANDNESKDLSRSLANQNARLRLESNRQLMELRTQAASGKLTKDGVAKAMAYIHPEAHAAAMETDPTTGLPKFNQAKYQQALHMLLVGTLGIPWEKVYSVYGGDPRVAAGEIGAEADKAAKELSGNAPVYRPTK